jgi:hypothetical protein
MMSSEAYDIYMYFDCPANMTAAGKVRRWRTNSVRNISPCPPFQGSEEEWTAFMQFELPITIPNHQRRDWFLVDVRCPHCGSQNTHNIRTTFGHRECDGPMLHDRNFKCPGYTLVEKP